MTPFQHSSCNTVLAAPPGVSIEDCRPLAVMRTDDADNGPGIMSFWKPNPEELALLNAGRAVAVWVQGWTHPPLFVGTAKTD